MCELWTWQCGWTLWPVPLAAGLMLHGTLHHTVILFSCAPPPLPFRAPLPPVSPPRCAPWFYPVVCEFVARQGWGGGGAPDAGSGPSLREFPHGGADACTPRQGVTLLYGPSICTRSVQMDVRRNQVRRPFPTVGSGTRWVSGESLRDRRVSCLPRWTVCPTRSPSQDTNHSTCHWECSWSGPLATPPGRCHLGPLAKSPGRYRPYCLRSGGADTDTRGAPKPLRSGPSPACFAGSCHPGPYPVRCGVGPCLPAFFPRGVPLSRAPCRASWLLPCPVCPCCLSLLWRVGVLCFFLHLYRSPLISPPGVSVPPPCPLPLSSLSSPLSWMGGGEGGGGGGRPRCPSSGVSTSQARRRHEARHLSLCRGGRLAVWLPSLPFLPCVCTPGATPAGACMARASYGRGPVVRPAPSLRCLPTLPLCPRRGGALSAPPYLHPPPLGGQRCVRGGEALSSSLCCTHVAGTTQAPRRHEARHLSLCRGGGMPCGSHRLPYYRAFAPPVVPPLGPARRVLSTGTVVWSVPHPLAAASPPCRFVLGGGALFAPPYLHPPPLGGRRCVCGGGRPCRLPCAARTSQARRKHRAGTRRGTCPFAGGGACLVAPIVSLTTVRSHPRWSPRWGLHGAWSLRARLCGLSLTLSLLPPHPAALSWGGGAFRPPLPASPTLGGAEVCVCGGAPLSSSLCSTHVAGTTQAWRRDEARHLSLCRGGGLPCVTRRRPSLPACAPPGGRRCVCGGGGGLPCRRPFPGRRHKARHLSLCRGGGMPCGSRRRPSYRPFAPPVVPPLGLARRVLSTGTVVSSVPHPLAAASPPCRFVLGGGRFSPPPTCIPHPWGGRRCVGGGGALVVFPAQHAQ